jgi:hypothetical protein
MYDEVHERLRRRMDEFGFAECELRRGFLKRARDVPEASTKRLLRMYAMRVQLETQHGRLRLSPYVRSDLERRYTRACNRLVGHVWQDTLTFTDFVYMESS